MSEARSQRPAGAFRVSFQSVEATTQQPRETNARDDLSHAVHRDCPIVLGGRTPSDGQPAAASPPAHLTAPRRQPSGAAEILCAFGAVLRTMPDPMHRAFGHWAPGQYYIDDGLRGCLFRARGSLRLIGGEPEMHELWMSPDGPAFPDSFNCPPFGDGSGGP